ncbi:hypothetical protein ACIRSJ_12490 [Streptomyces virginiae]|uniref:hypothetical protein n=1 Tax=Streptomyces virginiae TaxID=1961 RepID=UPI0038028881
MTLPNWLVDFALPVMGAAALALATDLRRRVHDWKKARSAGVPPLRGAAAARDIARAGSAHTGEDVTGVGFKNNKKVRAEGQEARDVNAVRAEGQEARGVADTS